MAPHIPEMNGAASYTTNGVTEQNGDGTAVTQGKPSVLNAPVDKFLASDLEIERVKSPGALSSDLSMMPPFGQAFSDHMLEISWTKAQGWGKPKIGPVRPLSLHPAALVLHYAIECFEGMKAYRDSRGRVLMFRPDMNMARFNRSCGRLGLPAFDGEELIKCLAEHLKLDAAFVPVQQEGYSLYMRPTAIATTAKVGLMPPTDSMIFCLLTPAAPFFRPGMSAVRLFVDTKNVRAFPGGVGQYKLGGNYAPTISPAAEAAKKGCFQALYAFDDGQPGGPKVGEAGACNMFFLLRKEGAAGSSHEVELVTPPLDGTVLPGVTRDSVLQLARSWGQFDVVERDIRLGEVERAIGEGRLLEMFGCGTAVCILPISSLLFEDGKLLEIPFNPADVEYWSNNMSGRAHTAEGNGVKGAPFTVTGRMLRAIWDIQYGVVDHPWTYVVG